MAKKHEKPASPVTDAIWRNVNVKTGLLLRKFKDFDKRRQEARREEINSQLVEAVMRAYEKFEPNDQCSYESFAGVFVDRAVSHYTRDAGRAIPREAAGVSMDVETFDDEGYPTTRGAMLEDGRDAAKAAADAFDLDEVTACLEHVNPTYARIFSLRREGCTFAEIRDELGVELWEFKQVLWPATVAAAKKIYDCGFFSPRRGQ